MIRIPLFVASAATMAFELAGARVLAPYLGTSIDVWSCLIATILGGLSLGYWLGGRVADRHPSRTWLAGTLMLAASGVVLARVLHEVVPALLASAPLPLTLATLLTGIVLFLPASLFLGAVSPFASRLLLTELRDTGRTVGSLSAIATVGSIVGTVLTGSWLIGVIGTAALLDAVALALVGSSLLVAWRWKRPARLGAAAVIVVLGLSGAGMRGSAVADVDTAYARIRVYQDALGGLRTVQTDPFGTQCAAALGEDGTVSDELVIPYVAFFDVAFDLMPDAERGLVIGGCNYSYPKHLLATRPGSVVDVFELDPGMTQVARDWFGLREDPRMRIVHGDARRSMEQVAAGSYDAIFVDAYNAQVAIPWQLTTRESLQRMADLLDDRGVVAINVVSTLEGDGAAFLRAEYATAKAVFPDVRIYQVEPREADQVQNIMLVGLKGGVEAPEMTERLAQEVGPDEEDLAGLVLTDDFAPVERLTEATRNLLR